MTASVTIIANPSAGRGRLGRNRAKIEGKLRSVFPDCDIVYTSKRGDGRELGRLAAGAGSQMVVAAGGNGTANEVADGLLGLGLSAEQLPHFGLLPIGVGVDLARSLDLPRSLDRVLERLADPSRTRTIDAGVLEFADGNGTADRRHFVNIASAGISAAVAHSVNGADTGGMLPGSAVFFLKSVRALWRYRFRTCSLWVDGELVYDEPAALIAVANGRFFGGGMAIAPDAVMDDGMLDVVAVRGSTKMYLLDNMNKIYSGAHRNLPIVKIMRGRSIRIEASGGVPLPIEIDGETPGHGSLQVDVVPKALRIRG